jgi:hypothetical protein
MARGVRRVHHTVMLCFALALVSPAAAWATGAWTQALKLNQAVDLSRPLAGGGIIVDATNGLGVLRPGKPLAPFAPGYMSSGGDEPYMVVSPAHSHRGCSFGKERVYVLRLAPPTGVIAIDRGSSISQFAALPVSPTGSETGITFDEVGRFGYRLLVVVTEGIESALYAIDCHGRASTLAQHMPKIEGGMEVAPKGFGRFGGYLIAPDEVSGHVYAIPPDGRGEVLTVPPLQIGSDVGVESVGFVPPRFGGRWRALIADRVTPDNPHPGDGVILGIRGAQLIHAGVKPGDLLAVTEGSAQTATVRCHRICHAWPVATGPAIAHPEGHLTFVH